jgi:hypothetical protein
MIFKIFPSKKIARKLAFLLEKQAYVIMQKIDHNIGFKEKCQFLLLKI